MQSHASRLETLLLLRRRIWLARVVGHVTGAVIVFTVGLAMWRHLSVAACITSALAGVMVGVPLGESAIQLLYRSRYRSEQERLFVVGVEHFGATGDYESWRSIFEDRVSRQWLSELASEARHDRVRDLASSILKRVESDIQQSTAPVD